MSFESDNGCIQSFEDIFTALGHWSVNSMLTQLLLRMVSAVPSPAEVLECFCRVPASLASKGTGESQGHTVKSNLLEETLWRCLNPLCLTVL